MRAHYVSPLAIQDEYVLSGDSLHHLVNVVRIEEGEELLLLDGNGLFIETRVERISKRELRLKKTSHDEKGLPYHFELALGMPKREALELCLKQATELGFRKIYLVKSDYSQMKFPEEDRALKLLISALEQSNGPYLPELQQATWEEIPWSGFEEAILLDSQTKITRAEARSHSGKKLLIVGPEGGFSPDELSFLHSQEVVKVINLPTPILRTPTAMATGAGLLIESLLK